MILITNYISMIIFFVISGLGFVFLSPLMMVKPIMGSVLFSLVFIVALFISSGIKIAAQWEKAVVFRLGKYSSIKGPGVFFIIPMIDEIRIVDTRILTMDIPKQQVITKDNVPVSINGVLYFLVSNPEAAVIKVQNYSYAISQYAQAALRDVVGGMTFDDLLAEREQIGKSIESIVEKESKEWGLEVKGIKIQDVDVPEDLKKMMSRQASAEREKRATITKAEGDKLAAMNLAEAAKTMSMSPGAMQLRTLQTIDGLGPTASNTVVLAVPVELYDLVRKFASNQSKS
ncbi:MAG: SPFH domain-containing protein [Candidatus Melainabacteria bacterium]|nr:SPFH domain-containing protein [Candidatus Melainabacteria bacterium]